MDNIVLVIPGLPFLTYLSCPSMAKAQCVEGPAPLSHLQGPGGDCLEHPLHLPEVCSPRSAFDALASFLMPIPL